MRHVTFLYFNVTVRYSYDALKIQYYYLDLIEFQNTPLTYSLSKKLGIYHKNLTDVAGKHLNHGKKY